MELRKVTFKNMDELMALDVREDQREFVAPNMLSLAEAYVAVSGGYTALPFGIYEGDKPVGFAMFGYGSLDDPEEPDVAQGNYCLWRLMIDKEFQGRGLGRRAVEACMEYLSGRPAGPAEKVWLSFEPENSAARELYRKFGFVENGEMCGEEIVAVREL